jgi:uncharacterized Zn finger protein
MTELILSREAEAQILRQRREELQALEAEIAVKEPELIGLQTELLQFERIYLGVVGTRYDDLAEIEKEISRLQGLEIGDEDDGGSGSIANDAVGCGQNRFHADKLKKLYREVARKFHPDLVTCEIERHHRHQLMVEANRAYESGAEDRLNDLLKAGESLESVSDVAMSAEMILLLRKIEEAKSSLAGIEADTANILASELYRLMRRIEAADTLGVNILNDLVSQVDRQIRKAKNRLEHLRELVVS